MKNINYLDHPYWIPKCLNIGRISIPLQIFPYIYFPQIFTQIGCMIENVKIPIIPLSLFIYIKPQSIPAPGKCLLRNNHRGPRLAKYDL